MAVKLIFKIIAIAAIFCSTTISAQINPATNKIAVDVSTYHVQNTAYNYDSSFAIGKNLGMNEVGLFINWTMLETAPNTFDFTILDIANIYYPTHSMPLDINLNPINTNRLEVPSDLDSMTFDNPIFINRYKTLLDSVKVHIPLVTISSFIIGSEIGAYLGTDTVKWAQYTVFYNSVSTYAKTLWTGLNVAVELQFADLINYNSFAQQINTNSDYIGVSYYPTWGNFTVKPPYIVGNDMDTLVNLYPTKPICFYQFGYPSSPTCNSSDSLQAEFVNQTFLYWDYYATHIRLIDFTWITDLDTAAVNYYGTYYGLTDTIFLEFLRTIGLREWNGNGIDKPALNELRCQTKQRGYNTLPIICNTVGLNDIPISENNFTISPNPANTILNIELSGDCKNAKIIVFNQLGQIEKSILNINSRTIHIETSDLKSGLYFIVLQNSDRFISRKFIICK